MAIYVGNLSELKKYLNLTDAADFLSDVFGSKIREEDILQYVADKQLIMTLILKDELGIKCSFVSENHQDYLRYCELLEEGGVATNGEPFARLPPSITGDEIILYYNEVRRLDGPYDLCLGGRHQLHSSQLNAGGNLNVIHVCEQLYSPQNLQMEYCLANFNDPFGNIALSVGHRVNVTESIADYAQIQFPRCTLSFKTKCIEAFVQGKTADSPQKKRSGDERSRSEVNITRDDDSNPLGVFQSMDDLKFNEITIRLDLENLMFRVSARNENAIVPLKAFDLMKRNAITPNRQFHVLLTFAYKTFNRETKGATRAARRLSHSFRKAFNTTDIPFVGMNPQFRLRIPKDDDAKFKAQRGSRPYDDIKTKLRSRGDIADEFLITNDPQYNPDSYN